MNALTEHKSRLYTLIGVGLAMLLGALDQTIVSTAMPRIVSELNGLDRYTWTTTIYLLVSTLLVPVFGKLSDIYSRKRLEIISVTIFLAGSVLCGMAGEFGPLPLLGDGMNQLIVFRAVQGLGGAGIFSLAFIIVSDLYPPRERGKIGGLFGGVFGLASVLGPLVGGFLTDNAGGWLPGIEGWRWVFYVNVPIGAVALWFIVARMPRLHPHDHSHKMNILSAVLMISAFLPLTLALQLDKTINPWNGPVVLSLFGASALLLGLWIWHSLKADHPILDLRLFKNRIFTTGTIASFLFGAGFMGTLIFIPLYMVNVQEVSATSAGVSVIPISMGLILGASLSGPIVSKIGRYKGVIVTGGVLSVLGSVMMAAFLGVDTPYWSVILMMIVVGLGFGPAMSIFPIIIQNTVSPREMGQATSSVQFFRQMGSVVGGAVLGAVFTVAISANFATNIQEHMRPTQMSSAGQEAAIGSKGPAELRRDFDNLIARTETLFNARGTEARSLLEEFQSDVTVPEQFRELLNTTPAIGIEAQFEGIKTELAAALRSGNSARLDAVLNAMATPIATQGIDAGATSAEMDLPFDPNELFRLLTAPESVKEPALSGIMEGMDTLAADLANKISAAALIETRAAIENTRDTLIAAIRRSFSDAMHQLWLISIFIMGSTLIVILLIPSVPLRGRGEHGPSTGTDGEAQDAQPPMVH